MKKMILIIALPLTFLSLSVYGKETELPKPLNEKDLKLYTEIFSLQQDGKFKLADSLIDKLDSKILLGRVKAQRYLHPTAYISKFSELKTWLDSYSDHPSASRIFWLSNRKKPKSSKQAKFTEI